MIVPPVSHYMTYNPYAIGSGELVSAARALMAAHRIHHLPVVDGDVLVGILSEDDVTGAAADGRIGDAMTRDVATVTATARLDEVVALMTAGRFGSVVVTGERGVVGIFTLCDALRAFGEFLAA